MLLKQIFYELPDLVRIFNSSKIFCYYWGLKHLSAIFWHLKGGNATSQVKKKCPCCQKYLSCVLWDFHLQKANTTANRSMTGQPGLEGCQYIDWMSESLKTRFFKKCLFLILQSPAMSRLLPVRHVLFHCFFLSPHTLANFRHRGRKHSLSRLDSHTDRKSKVNWTLRRDD